jgi:putative oxidoreductase
MKSPPAQRDDYGLLGMDSMAPADIPRAMLPRCASPGHSPDKRRATYIWSLPVFPQRTFPSKKTALFITWMLRLVVGGAFIFSGALKIADPAKFAIDVSNYRLVPHELINLVAIFMPWMEVVAGAFVLAGIWLRAAALVIAGMTVMFAVVIMSALARGLNIECGCFGTLGGKHIGVVNLAIDMALFCLAAWLARCSQGLRSSAREYPAQPAHLDPA